MQSLNDLIAASLEAARSAQPIVSLTRLMEKTISQKEWLKQILPEAEEDETLLYLSDELTIYSIKLTPGVLYPPHSHGMPVVIGFYEGCETSLIFEQESGGNLRQIDRIDFDAPCVGHLEKDAIHCITNYGEITSRAIHYYLGDLVSEPRSLWNPDSMEVMPFDNGKYFEYAKPNSI
ncbi:hypothetical protein [Kiloniella sp. EL199]|uniref:hypothetical protein n=1 Tax=Kiloniella sp. EL199 TaxID=2107581 RepID=UPI000EA0EAD4|nr:hypothetical protein [Kiloniella sp. EL199]